MSATIEITIAVTDNTQKEILVALLSDTGASGFEEERAALKVYVPGNDFDETVYQEIIEQNGLTYSISIIEDKNWNALWEADFHPVRVGDFCVIRAGFHAPNKRVKHEIIITPKMSFGTGHHATTHMMVQAMEEIEFKEKRVFDFGTGTGVLAILAEKLGAGTIMAIDNDEWSIINADENFKSNSCHKILLFKSEEFIDNKAFDIILANINRNVILQNMGAIKQHLSKDGVVLLSGLLTGDEPLIIEEARKNQLYLSHRLEMSGWICLRMVSKQ